MPSNDRSLTVALLGGGTVGSAVAGCSSTTLGTSRSASAPPSCSLRSLFATPRRLVLGSRLS